MCNIGEAGNFFGFFCRVRYLSAPVPLYCVFLKEISFARSLPPDSFCDLHFSFFRQARSFGGYEHFQVSRISPDTLDGIAKCRRNLLPVGESSTVP